MQDDAGTSEYHSGDCVIRPATRRLLRDGVEVELEAKVFDLILLLVRDHARALGKQELIEKLWGRRPITDAALSQLIYKARRACGDDGEQQRLIRTIYARGLQWVAPVHCVAAEAAAKADSRSSPMVAVPMQPAAPNPQSAAVHPHVRTRRWWLSAASLAAVVAMAATAWSILASRDVQPASSPLSIAVLPFQNLSTDEGNAYFAAGIQDEILTELAKIKGLKVIARTSTRQYASRPDDLQAIGRRLGVTTLLEGSVQRAGDEVHINVQLIDAASRAHIWAHSYNRNLDDIFEVEGEVATEIAQALDARLSHHEATNLAAPPTRNPDAYLAFLKANHLADRVHDLGNVADPAGQAEQAIAHYHAAVARDPGFALAWAQLSILESRLWWFDIDASPKHKTAAEADARRAFELDPNLATSHMAIGYAEYYFHHDYAKARGHFERALEQSPNNVDAIAALAYIERRQGQWPAALAGLHRAMELDNQNPRRHFEVAVTLTEMRRYDEADQQLAQTLALEPHDYTAMAYRVRMLLIADKPAAAREALASIPAGVDPLGAVSALRFESAWLAHDPRAALAALDGAPAWVMDARFQYTVPVELLRGRALSRVGDEQAAVLDFARARDELQEALAKQPDSPTLWGAMGLAQSGLHDDAAAIDAGQHAVRLLPLSKDAFYGTVHALALAQIYCAAGDPGQAVKLLRTLLAIPSGGAVSRAVLRANPTWDPIRRTPGFEALVN
ncbi:MAG TPA: tetratricopeptide repeat protein [Rhodanobacteraceae bacterium]|nr:tetratricopeptide repeat protein [Rhodanobacteraceae bacterium]